MKKKQTIRLNESQLHRIIKESVKKVLKEGYSRNSIEQNIIDMMREFPNQCSGPSDDLWIDGLVNDMIANPEEGYDEYIVVLPEGSNNITIRLSDNEMGGDIECPFSDFDQAQQEAIYNDAKQALAYIVKTAIANYLS